MAVPNIFGNVTTTIPLSQLDQNFATAITLGNTAVYLGNTTTTLGNVTLTNANIASVAVTIPNSFLANSAVTIGNTSVSLGNTTTSFGNVTLTNATVSSGTISGTTTINTSGTAATGNLSVTGIGSVTTGFAVGGATPGTGGVAFPATAVAVSDANTLDDYEEGTWTPSLGGNATYTTQTGTYTKIGRLVYVYCNLAVNALGTGGQTISGLPFAAAGGSEPSTCLWNSLAINSVYLAFYSNGTSVYHQNATAAAASLTDGASIFTSGTAVKFCLVYNV
jgi:hypothetical protein